jgi:short-subunit dehydrogenase
VSEKKIIIIGASSGMGLEIARIYAAKGCRVAITGRRKDLLLEAAAAFPGNLLPFCFDVNGNENGQVFQQMVTGLGSLDLLVYNSGYGELNEALDPTIELQTVGTNVAGFTEITALAFTFFEHQGHGQIALTSSVAALRGNSYAPAYSASKAYMSNYAEGLSVRARRLKKKIVVTDIRPGFVKTKMAKGHGQFWVAEVEKAAAQIVEAIEKKKRVAYITRRWRLIGWLMKWMPYGIYKRMV